MGEVAALHGGPITSDARQAFLDVVAQRFDEYIANHSIEPEALGFVFAHDDHAASVHWLARGHYDTRASIFLCRAAVMLAKAAQG